MVDDLGSGRDCGGDRLVSLPMIDLKLDELNRGITRLYALYHRFAREILERRRARKLRQ